MSLTELTNRKVWFDGTNQVDPDMVPELFLHGVKPANIAVNYLNADIKKFNQLSEVQISANKTENNLFSMDWDVPHAYLEIELNQYVETKLALMLHAKKFDTALQEKYILRLQTELKYVKQYNMESLFRTLIYVLDTLRASNTVWGVGRGSSCASLILYLIGIHKVDPVKFGIPATEFFHD
jgi:DNA polymerase III alpha subunit